MSTHPQNSIQHFTVYAGDAHRNGYPVFPLKHVPQAVTDKESRNKRKTPAIRDWRAVTIDKNQISKWNDTHAICGVAQRLGEDVFVLDVDLKNSNAAKIVKHQLTRRYPDALFRFREDSSKFAMIARADSIKRKGVVEYSDPEEHDPAAKSPKIEVLSNGQYVMIFGTHPDGAALDWIDGRSPATVPVDQLSEIDFQDLLTLVIEINNEIVHELGWTIVRSTIERCSQERGESSETDDLPPSPLSPDDAVEMWDRAEFLLIKKKLAEGDRETWRNINWSLMSTGLVSRDSERQIDASVVRGHDEYGDRETVAKSIRGLWDSYDPSVAGYGYGTLVYLSDKHGYREYAARNRLMSCTSIEALRTVVAEIGAEKNFKSEELERLIDVVKLQCRSLEIEESRESELLTAVQGVPMWCRNIAFLTAQNKYYDIATGDYLLRASLNTTYASQPDVLARNKPPATLLEREYGMRRYSDICYSPGEPEEVMEHSRRLLNTYRESNAMREAKRQIEARESIGNQGQVAIDTLLDHFRRLLPDERERGLLLDWIAFRMQNPRIRINHAVLLQGGVGSGKTEVATLIRSIVGDLNCNDVSPTVMEGNFNDWQDGAMFSFVEEVKFSGTNRYDVINRLKPAIANDKLSVNAKHLQPKQINNVTNYLMFSNYKNAIPFDQDDRRYCILFCSSQTPEDRLRIFGGGTEEGCVDYFRNLRRVISENAVALARFFLERDVLNYAAKGNAPRTAAKDEMFHLSRPVDEYQLDQLVKAYWGPAINDEILSVTLLRQKERTGIADCFDRNQQVLPNTARLTQILRHEGWEQARIKVRGAEHSVWYRGATLEKMNQKELRARLREAVEVHDDGCSQIEDGNVTDLAQFREASELIEAEIISNYEEFRLLINDHNSGK